MARQILNFLLLSAFFTATSVQAQDPIFSQFYATPLIINPAFTGTSFAPRISAGFRQQWPSVIGDGFKPVYSTYAASYEQFVPAFNSGFGILILSDNAGDGLLKSTDFNANYAYRVNVNEDFHFKIGASAGFRQTSLDWDKLVFLDQLDPINGPTDPSGNPNPTFETRPEELGVTVFDVGAGLLAYSSQFYGGISLQHLTTPDEGFLQINSGLTEGLPLRVSLHGGAQFIVKEGNKRQAASFISPNILFLKQGGYGQINAGAYASLGSVFAGGWFRHAFGNSDAVIGMAGFQYDVFKIGYSYDFTVSKLSSAPSGGAHELSLVINLENSENLRRKRFNERYNDCFKIFR